MNSGLERGAKITTLVTCNGVELLYKSSTIMQSNFPQTDSFIQLILMNNLSVCLHQETGKLSKERTIFPRPVLVHMDETSPEQNGVINDERNLKSHKDFFTREFALLHTSRAKLKGGSWVILVPYNVSRFWLPTQYQLMYAYLSCRLYIAFSLNCPDAFVFIQ